MPKKTKLNPKPRCTHCNQSKTVIASGIRTTIQGKKQQFYCKTCKKYFRDTKLKHQHYPPTIILNAISTYNLGHSIQDTNTIINHRYNTSIPKSTTHSWLQRYSNIFTFTNTLRKRYTLDPKDAIYSKKFYHLQVYNFKYHNLKLNIAGKKFPRLKTYIKSLPEECPDKPFRYGPRCSKLRINIKPTKNTKYNIAPKLAEMAMILAKTNRARHDRIENFFLTNDSVTIAIETPVYIYPNELSKRQQKMLALNLKEPLSGHIDILQVRWNKIHILDYKPNTTRNDQAAIDQLYLYALALSKRTKIPLDKFGCAYFNDKDYFQFPPILH
jgi:ATP-dependent exoDNAse (exonuclease V) beta subunit/transposase-like protein